jgi:hypothetical protein
MEVTFDTAPAFGQPSVPPVIDVPPFNHRRPGVSQVTLKSGVTLPLPVRNWNTRALVLCGLADSKALDAALTKFRKRPTTTVRVNRDILPEKDSSQSFVAIWAPDYEGCSIGPIKVVFAASWIMPFNPKDLTTYRFTWWLYFGNSPTNSEFKGKVWGLENNLAAVETSYVGNWKSARYLEDGKPALTMALDVSRLRDYDETPVGDFERHKFISVSQRKHTKDNGENEVWLRVRRLRNTQPVVDPTRFPFDPHRDIYRCDPNSTLGRALGEVGFLPVSWEFLTNYSGVVWLTQPDGRGTAPPWPDAQPSNGNKPPARRRKRRPRTYKVKR